MKACLFESTNGLRSHRNLCQVMNGLKADECHMSSVSTKATNTNCETSMNTCPGRMSVLIQSTLGLLVLQHPEIFSMRGQPEVLMGWYRRQDTHTDNA